MGSSGFLSDCHKLLIFHWSPIKWQVTFEWLFFVWNDSDDQAHGDDDVDDDDDDDEVDDDDDDTMAKDGRHIGVTLPILWTMKAVSTNNDWAAYTMSKLQQGWVWEGFHRPSSNSFLMFHTPAFSPTHLSDTPNTSLTSHTPVSCPTHMSDVPHTYLISHTRIN